jgi:predicted nucleotidyltransferase
MDTLEQLKTDVKEQLAELYLDRLDKIVLYGSYARGSQHENSDIDFLVVLKDKKIRRFHEIAYMTDVIYDLELVYNKVISTMPATSLDYQREDHPFYFNVREDAIEL